MWGCRRCSYRVWGADRRRIIRARRRRELLVDTVNLEGVFCGMITIYTLYVVRTSEDLWGSADSHKNVFLWRIHVQDA